MPFSATPSIWCISPYGFGGLEETDAVIVGVAHEAGEVLLSEFALHAAAERAGAEREARHFDARFAERDPIRGAARRGARRNAAHAAQTRSRQSRLLRKSRLE